MPRVKACVKVSDVLAIATGTDTAQPAVAAMKQRYAKATEPTRLPRYEATHDLVSCSAAAKCRSARTQGQRDAPNVRAGGSSGRRAQAGADLLAGDLTLELGHGDEGGVAREELGTRHDRHEEAKGEPERAHDDALEARVGRCEAGARAAHREEEEGAEADVAAREHAEAEDLLRRQARLLDARGDRAVKTLLRPAPRRRIPSTPRELWPRRRVRVRNAHVATCMPMYGRGAVNAGARETTA